METINRYLERGSKIFGCFLDVRKGFDTVWTDGLFYKLFTELGINGRFWLALEDLYADVNANLVVYHVRFQFLRVLGKGEFFTFYVKVYKNSLLIELSEHNFVICVSGMKLSATSFADDISLLVLYPTSFPEYCLRVQLEMAV